MVGRVRTVARGSEPLTSSIIWFPTSLGRTDYVDRLARVAGGGELWVAAELAAGDLGAEVGIVELARAQADRIARAALPAPWVLAGWAVGALVALEAARALVRHGSIRLLLAIESKIPDQPAWSQRASDDDTIAKIYLHHRFGFRGYPISPDAPCTLDHVASLLREHAIEADATVASVSRDLERFAYHVRAANRYHAQPFAGPIALCAVKADGKDLGWDRLGTRVQHYDLEGDHLSVMSDAHAAHTALTVRRALDD
jgi:thioesterase domain-containing protein